MVRNTNEAQRNRSTHDMREKVTALVLEFLLAIVTVFSLPEAFEKLLRNYFGDSLVQADVVASVVSLAIAILIIGLSVGKFFYLRTRRDIELDYRREQKINQINRTVFDSLYKAEASKLREIFRYTYGSVPEWNPIDYKENVLVYDVHEQIRSILISLEGVVINIDPERFSDKNVSVELVYCYPIDAPEGKGYTMIPMKKGSFRGKHPWKLISSGDTSGDQQSVLSHLEQENSFFTLLDSCGTVFKNNKFEKIDEQRLSLVRKRLLNQIGDEKRFFVEDIRDWERSKDGESRGTAIGTIINIRNDNPEEVFVKAILTINTYGESIFVPSEQSNGRKPTDRHGLTCSDYENVFVNTIMSTYSKLLETELAQMYIRHSIRNGFRCRKSGRLIKRKEDAEQIRVCSCSKSCGTNCEGCEFQN